ncbi:MAG: response regulator transcription factor [Proteobacteria bacterium]|nr:response regulator transcription factor [Pseudomonadota bacterium]
MNGLSPRLSVFIAEDEAPARARLVETLRRVAPHAEVAGWAASVLDAADWLAHHPPPDLLLLDIQLADGLSLELFADAGIASPVVFTTAHDEFVLQAFRAQAIDYLLKPIQDDALAAAIAKHARLARHFAGSDALLGLRARLAAPQRLRVVGRKGAHFVALPIEQVAYFVTADKLGFAVATDGTRCLLDTPLAELEAGLDPARFFRVNRQYLVSAPAIVRFGPAGKGRLALALAPRADGEVVVSQERAAAFREWLAQ